MSNQIIIGTDVYENDKIISVNAYMYQSIDGNELQYNTLDSRLTSGELEGTKFIPKDSTGLVLSDGSRYACMPYVLAIIKTMSEYKYGTPVSFMHNGELIGRFYVGNVKRTGRYEYKIHCVSAIGLMVKSRHYGGIYNNADFADVLADIVGGMFTYSVSPEIENVKVSGWLPVASRRDNLHQLLFPNGIGIKTERDGSVTFSPFQSSVYTQIPDSRIYVGGSVEYPDEITKVTVAEHSFFQSPLDPEVALFEGELVGSTITAPNGVTYEDCGIVIFNEPCHNLAAENCEIKDSGVNYAVITSSVSAKLTGKKYSHTIRQIIREAENVPDSASENTVDIRDATLVSLINSESVAERVFSFYNAVKTVSNSIVLAGEKAGSAVKFHDPFYEETVGLIQAMDINASGTLKANLEVISGYTPIGPEAGYSHVDVLTGTGTWTVPAGVKKIHIVLIQGGQGGWSGCIGGSPKNYGHNETVYSEKFRSRNTRTNGLPGKGGLHGNGGNAGKIFRKTIKTPTGGSFAYSTGNGGPGGIYSPEASVPGGSGEESIFGEYSSANGDIPSTGYSDVIEGVIYAVTGNNGIDGGEGSIPTGDYDDTYTQNSVVGPDGVTYVSGTRNVNHLHDGDYEYHSDIQRGLYVNAYAIWGFGSGAAVGSNGINADENSGAVGPSVYAASAPETATGLAYGGYGPTGADAILIDNVVKTYGTGGIGGNGGGGAGASGAAQVDMDQEPKRDPTVSVTRTIRVFMDHVDVGGKGSDGGPGAPGCALVYY